MRSSKLFVGLPATLVTLVTSAAEPDFSTIRYGGDIGCGLYVQFFKADGTEAVKDGKSAAFFPGGAPPNTSRDACLAKCDQWAADSFVKMTSATYTKSLAVTKVTGTCYLHGNALGPPRTLSGN